MTTSANTRGDTSANEEVRQTLFIVVDNKRHTEFYNILLKLYLFFSFPGNTPEPPPPHDGNDAATP